jgi:hypothetical protein
VARRHRRLQWNIIKPENRHNTSRFVHLFGLRVAAAYIEIHCSGTLGVKTAAPSLKLSLVIALRPQTSKHIIRDGWSHYTDISEPVDGNGAQNMVTV